MTHTREQVSPTMGNDSSLRNLVRENSTDTRSDNEKNEQTIELVHDMLIVIALYTSVFDVPNLVLVNKFFASNSDVLWRHHAWRIYHMHPPSVLPDAHLEKTLVSWHDRFFMKYNGSYMSDHEKNYIRRGLQISEGRVKDLISEYYMVSQLKAVERG